ncbi:MAG: nucleoside 2-deoxyribosyltransferase domain-containing protein [Candidatus Odinarchaeota archaeon]
MKYIEAINEYENIGKNSTISIFIAGGITNCPDWQKDLVKLLKKTNLVIYNPRRKNFPIHNPNASFEQIKWEHKYLRKSDIISFWLSKGSLNPIVLFELGRWSHFILQKTIFVGIDPEYIRKKDVEIQLELEKPEIKIVYSLEALANQIIDYIKILNRG